MESIDGGIYNAQSSADSASAEAQNAQSSADNAQQTANTAVANAGQAQSKADSVDAKVGDIANLQTATKTNVVSSINEVNSKTNAIANMFNMSSFQPSVSLSQSTVVANELRVAKIVIHHYLNFTEDL